MTRSTGDTNTADQTSAAPDWRDPSTPIDQRVELLLAAMTLEEKTAQLHGLWVSADTSGAPVAPHQHDLSQEPPVWEEAIAQGLGQLTRPFGTVPVDPAAGRASLARSQREIMAANRFAIPALAHEECLTGFAAWTATVYPVPLAWGASFDPDLVERMAAQIGRSMRDVGVHQGLAPVLDVARDLRWGRTEETIGEDPHLVATVGTAYVRGLQSTGIVATLKHFAGHSASRAGRNLAPVCVGPREFADVLLPPFEMALREGRAGSVMHAYNDNDGLPAAADHGLLTRLLRDTWGFEGTVVADYFGVSFLHTLHGVAESPSRAGALALASGVDVELPTVACYGDRLVAGVRAGRVPEELVDRAARRVLRQKCALGMLDPDWSPEGPATAQVSDNGGVSGNSRALGPDPAEHRVLDLDPPEHRALARRLAEESVVLLDNPAGLLPLTRPRTMAVVGPLADTADAALGCYSFPAHVGRHHPDVARGVEIPTLLESLAEELPKTHIDHAEGCSVDGESTEGFAEALTSARAADVCVAVLGDRSDLFGRGTTGEGCDATGLTLPGVQQQFLEELVATGTPVVAVLVSGRPYALGTAADRLAASVQAFFPGEEGGSALAGVLSGRVNPSGRLPVSVPRDPGGQPATYLGPPLAHRNQVSSVDPTARHAFGHGLSYTSFGWENPRIDDTPPDPGQPAPTTTDGSVTVECTVRNTGAVTGTEVVQLYLSDPVAQAAQPVRRLIGYTRVPLEPGRARTVRFTVHADLASYTGPAGQRIVEPGELVLTLAASSADPGLPFPVLLTGPVRPVDHTRRLTCDIQLGSEAPADPLPRSPRR
ncbi:glycoside hydrolase family 3 C-terminal domain-containing protein [Nocardiopsis exhalans]|uniref:Glycoside hydrolase family 3 C-terminal domain-containing protein n=1 Tax=Nocardiopsis exhalans TaxID=163604 RepID=A0ABY5DAS1_9ACTN|nr:glycoside hydrolase family 3 N-terminal domain-containing protein [Nocardiopsis exhalans]USY20186.1 glycoside hydrolase family 3 C-terminal domain-containing protein [Nocardiopsis exhalans]